jgi:hypothetical protein
VTHQYGIERGRPVNPHGRRMRLRVTNRRHIIAFHTSGDGGKTWHRFDRGMEVSGYHHNVRGGFLMLRPGLYAAGPGEAAFRDFQFTALDDEKTGQTVRASAARHVGRSHASIRRTAVAVERCAGDRIGMRVDRMSEQRPPPEAERRCAF